MCRYLLSTFYHQGSRFTSKPDDIICLRSTVQFSLESGYKLDQRLNIQVRNTSAINSNLLGTNLNFCTSVSQVEDIMSLLLLGGLEYPLYGCRHFPLIMCISDPELVNRHLSAPQLLLTPTCKVKKTIAKKNIRKSSQFSHSRKIFSENEY